MVSEKGEIKLLIIGGGLAGLSLASYHEQSIVFETRSRPGGFFLYDDLPVSRSRGKDLVSGFLSKAKVVTERMVYRVEENGVWTLGETGTEFHKGMPVLASGFREKTTLELGIYGYRPAGVFTLSSAWDFTNSGFLIGERILVYGFNHFSLSLVSKLSMLAEKIIVIYDEESFIYKPDTLREFGVEAVKGKVLYIEGKSRVEKVKTTAGEFAVDTLILACLTPLNMFTTRFATGNAAMIIEDPLKVVESSNLVAHAILEPGESGRIESNIPVVPQTFKLRHPYVMLGLREGFKAEINGRTITVDEPYPVVEIPAEKVVRIRAG